MEKAVCVTSNRTVDSHIDAYQSHYSRSTRRWVKDMLRIVLHDCSRKVQQCRESPAPCSRRSVPLQSVLSYLPHAYPDDNAAARSAGPILLDGLSPKYNTVKFAAGVHQ